MSFLLSKHKEESQIMCIYIEVPHFFSLLDTKRIAGNLVCRECYDQTERIAGKQVWLLCIILNYVTHFTPSAVRHIKITL
jgi:hypothetical protein